ncbi:MAG: hypothetical protein KC776_25735 [Myxococcales bacterium]|nr:hypothetical protein [Myxococcales bacterium]MCB9582558.1 hypothetical protein [Polyangiaceae bacterium]
MNPDSDDFSRAFVAASYLLERRDTQLTEPLLDPSKRALELAHSLNHAERPARAKLLAAELARVVRALAARRLA